MTTRQMFSIVLSHRHFWACDQAAHAPRAIIVFATIFNRIKRQAAKRSAKAP